MGTRGILPQPYPVQAQPHGSRPQGSLALPEQVSPLPIRPVVAKARSVEIRAQRGLQLSPGWKRKVKISRAGSIASPRHTKTLGTRSGLTVNDVDDPDEGGGSVHDGGSSAKDLDAVDAGQVQCREGRIEGAPPGNAVDEQQERVELPQPPELGDRAGRAAIATRCDVDPGGKSQSASEIVSTAANEILARDHRDGSGELAGFFRNSRGGHLHVLLGDGRRNV